MRDNNVPLGLLQILAEEINPELMTVFPRKWGTCQLTSQAISKKVSSGGLSPTQMVHGSQVQTLGACDSNQRQNSQAGHSDVANVFFSLLCARSFMHLLARYWLRGLSCCSVPRALVLMCKLLMSCSLVWLLFSAL
jgi:hypothetical protein